MIWLLHSLDDLNALVWALDFARSTGYAIIHVDGVRFSVVYFEHADRTRVFACSTTIALVVVYSDLNHMGRLFLKNPITDENCTIKAFILPTHVGAPFLNQARAK